MEIYKTLEATITKIQPDHPSIKDLRRDQALDQYDEAVTTLQTLIKTKQNEISYRTGLLEILDKSKVYYDEKLRRAREAYVTAKKYAPDSLDLTSTTPKSNNNATVSNNNKSISNDLDSSQRLNHQLIQSSSQGSNASSIPGVSSIPPIITSLSPQKVLNNMAPMQSENFENRSSLDRRLSEFLKTFPNLTQAGLGPATDNNNASKPSPGYYTQQQPPPPPPPTGHLGAPAPPMMAMLRFPPPNLSQPPPPLNLLPPSHMMGIGVGNHETQDVADMDLSDAEEPNGVTGGIMIPMVASAMQQGAGGKQGAPIPTLSPYSSGQANSGPAYAPRMNALPFDPSIMDTRLRDHGRDKSGSSRHSGGSSSSGSGTNVNQQRSDRSKYPSTSSTSSHSSSRSGSRRR